MKTLFKSGVWILFILFILLIILGLFVSTDSGTKVVSKLAQGFLSDLQISGIQGSAIRELKIKQLDWSNPDTKQYVHIENLHLKNNLSSLLTRQVDIETLSIERLRLDLPPSNNKKTSLPNLLLPLNIRVSNVNIKQLIIKRGKNTQQINNISLAAESIGKRLVISKFTAQPVINTIPAQLALTGEVQLVEPYKSNSEVNFNYADPERGKLTSRFTLVGTMDDYRLKGQAKIDSKETGAGKFTLSAKGTINDLVIQTLDLQAFGGTASASGTVSWQEQLKWDLALKADQLNAQAFAPQLPKQLSTRFNTQGVWKDKQAKGVIDLQALSGRLYQQDFSAKGKVQLDGYQAKIETLQLDALNGVLKGAGKLTWQEDIVWNLQLDGKDIRLNSVLPQWPSTFSSQLSTQGTIKQGVIDSSINLQSLQGTLHNYPLAAKGKITLTGQDIKNIKLDNLQINALDGVINTSGEVILADSIKWDMQVNSKKIKTKRLLPDWPAVLTLKLLSTGEYSPTNTKLDAFVNLQSLAGSLQNYPLAGKGKLYLKDKQLRLEKIQLSSGRNTLFADGQASEPFDLKWQIKGNKLKQLYKGLRGSLQGNGYLKGTLKQPQVQAKLNGTALAFQNYSAAKIKLDIQQKGSLDKPQIQAKLRGTALAFQQYAVAAIKLDVQQNRNQYQVNADLKKLKLAQQTIKTMNLKGQGSLEKHSLTLKLQHPQAAVRLKAAGAWRNQQWKGLLQQLNLDKTVAGNWVLTQPVSLKLAKNEVSTGRLCLKNQAALACSSTRWQKNRGISAKGNFSKIPLRLAQPWLKDSKISLANNAQADGEFTLKNQVGNLQLRLSDSQLTVKAEGIKPQQLNYQKTRVDARLNGTTLKTEFSTHIVNRGDITGKATLSNLNRANKQRIQGQINIDIPTITWVKQFVPDLQNLQGKATGQINLSGLLAKPQFTGRANLSNSRFSLPETGTQIEKINVSVISTQANKARISGTLRSGQGNLNIDGNIDISQLDNWQAKVKLSGQRLDFMNTYEIKGVVSPNLLIDATAKSVKITGSLTIPETRISLNEIPESAIYESSDVVIVGRHQARNGATHNKKSAPMPFKIHPNVAIIIGDKVSFSGFGLKTKLSGQFRLREQQQELFAQGNVKISEGTYKAYGQDLNITQGRLVFNGPFDNPGMDIKAVRELPQADVGIHLTGTLQAPQTKLFSDPLLSQTDTLSYLLTGRTLSAASGSDSNMLLSAITTLGISGGEGIARNIGTSLGLDDVNISSERGLKSSDLELGKRLGPNLYLKYIVGLFDAMQRIAIQYRINKRLTLEAQSGINQGFDLIYKMERD